MRLRTLAFVTAASALAGAAWAGPLGGAPVGGGVGGGVGGAIGGAVGGGHGGGAGGGIGGGVGGGIGGGVGGAVGALGGGVGAGIGRPMGSSHIDGGASGSLSGSLGAASRISGHDDNSAAASLGLDRDGREVSGEASASGASSTAAAATLPGLADGQTVVDGSGRVLGTVDGIERTRDRTVTGVLMTTANGEHRLLRLAPETLRVARGVVTTTQSMGALARGRAGRAATQLASRAGSRVGDTESLAASTARRAGPLRASATALARSNARAGLRTAGVTMQSLASLSPGMTVRSASGKTLGTVSRVIRSADGSVRAVLVRTASHGRRVLNLAPRSLTLSGGVVTTTATTVSAHG
ncbi:MAG TPA: hypothetical protein VHV27_06135 [Phenylobacterium sp.]|jgi:hypothetical protein|nr:hypothetical protein [Phenylobacterium sp.]